MTYTTLISTAALALCRDEPWVTLVDCRFKLDDPNWGEDEWATGHIEGAVYAHLERDLSGPTTGTNGRHPLPDMSAMVKTFGRLGITSGTQVVAYDQGSGVYASRLWWLLRWLGHDAVAVLDGGLAKWTAEGRSLSLETDRRAPANFQPRPRHNMLVMLNTVAAHVGDEGWRLLDARAPERFSGEVEPVDKVPGHIPGAVNYFYQGNLNDRGTFRKPEELRQDYKAVLGSVPLERLVCYCGSGVTACHTLLALEHAGMPGAKLYAGSWSEWSSDPARPIEATPTAGG